MRIVKMLSGLGHRSSDAHHCYTCIDCLPKRRPDTHQLTVAPWEGPYCHTGGQVHRWRSSAVAGRGAISGHYDRRTSAEAGCRCPDKTKKEGPPDVNP